MFHLFFVSQHGKVGEGAGSTSREFIRIVVLLVVLFPRNIRPEIDGSLPDGEAHIRAFPPVGGPRAFPGKRAISVGNLFANSIYTIEMELTGGWEGV